MLWLYIAIGIVLLFIAAEIGIAVYFFNFAIKPHPYDPYKKHEQRPELDMDAELKTYDEAKKGL